MKKDVQKIIVNFFFFVSGLPCLVTPRVVHQWMCSTPVLSGISSSFEGKVTPEFRQLLHHFFCFVSGCVYAEYLFPDTLMPCFFFSPNRVLIFIPRYYHHLSPASPHHDTNSRRSLKTETTNQPTVTLLYRKSINLVLVLLLQPTCFILTHSFCYSVLHNTTQFSTNISPPSFNLLV